MKKITERALKEFKDLMAYDSINQYISTFMFSTNKAVSTELSSCKIVNTPEGYLVNKAI